MYSAVLINFSIFQKKNPWYIFYNFSQQFFLVHFLASFDHITSKNVELPIFENKNIPPYLLFFIFVVELSWNTLIYKNTKHIIFGG